MKLYKFYIIIIENIFTIDLSITFYIYFPSIFKNRFLNILIKLVTSFKSIWHGQDYTNWQLIGGHFVLRIQQDGG